MSLDLSQPRVIAFTDRKRPYSITCKPITKDMWLKYFSGIISSSEVVDGDSSSSYDSSGARLQLLESAITAVTGYDLTDEQKASMPSWRSKLPLRHRLAAADVLVDVKSVTLPDDAVPPFGLETIALQATWSANKDGHMQAITGLLHVFNEPTPEHQVRYSRAMSRSVVLGGSRTGETRWIGAQDVLIEIYDELITAVEGYNFGNDFVATDRDRIVAVMDSYHKVAAATGLFKPIDVQAA